MTRGSSLVVFALFAAGTSCRTPESTRPRQQGKTVWVTPADLACDGDWDCTIRDADRGCCCECYACRAGTEPFAISERASAAWDKECAGAICPMNACPDPVGHRVEDFHALCVNHACERRAKR